MATNLPNQARLSYTYGDATGSVLSNTTNTALVDRYTMAVTKETVVPSVGAGEAAAYIIRVDNTGAGPIYNLSVVDDLGTGSTGAAPLTYTANSAKFYVNGDPVTGTVTSGTNNVTFAYAGELRPGDTFTVVYAAAPTAAAEGTITNTANAAANSGTATGTVITGSDTAELTVEASANLSMLKTADKTSVVSGDTLTYTFTLVNTGNAPADSISITDALPREFTVTGISYTVNGETNIVPTTNYTVSATNQLTLPTGDLVLTVPAATSAGPGVMTVTVTGTIA